MAFPADVQLRNVTAGISFGFTDGADVTMEATFTANRTLVWGPTGDIAIPKPYVLTIENGRTAVLPLPVTDQVGWRTRGGAAVSVAGGLQSHLYDVHVVFKDERHRKVGDAFEFTMPLYTGDLSPIDLELLLPVEAEDGMALSIPDQWSVQLAAAQAAAEAAQDAAQAAADSAGSAIGYDGGTTY